MQPIKQIYFVITDSCNADCGFCIRKNLPKANREMQLSSIKEVLVKLSCFYPDSALIITGGEPSLHPEFKKIVNFASKQFNNVVITTNGSFSVATREYLQNKLQTNVYLQISLDGTKDIHRKLRKNEKLFDTILDNLRAMQSNSRHIALSTTVNEINYDNISSFSRTFPDMVNTRTDIGRKRL